MKKQILKLLFASAVALASTFAQAEPSRLFSQELGEVGKDISVDLDYHLSDTSPTTNSTGLAAGVRIPAFGGEVMVNTKNNLDLDRSGFTTAGAGYKATVSRGLAVYGILSYDKVNPPGPGVSPDATSNLAIGAAYTMRQGNNLILTVNPEMVTDDGNLNGRGDKTTMFLKTGVGYILPDQKYGKWTLIGEFIAENSDFLDTTFNLGARWERKNFTVDAVVLNNRGDKGGSNTGIPGAIRVNIAF